MARGPVDGRCQYAESMKNRFRRASAMRGENNFCFKMYFRPDISISSNNKGGRLSPLRSYISVYLDVHNDEFDSCDAAAFIGGFTTNCCLGARSARLIQSTPIRFNKYVKMFCDNGCRIRGACSPRSPNEWNYSNEIDGAAVVATGSYTRVFKISFTS